MNQHSTIRVRTSSPDETRELGRRLGQAAHPGDVIALSGQLGAGKTCLVQGLALGLGLPEAMPVSSPTFAILHELPARMPLYHMDFYRLNGAEIDELGFEEQMEGIGVTVAEWAEHWPEFLDRANLRIRIAARGDDRELVLESADLRFLDAAEGRTPC